MYRWLNELKNAPFTFKIRIGFVWSAMIVTPLVVLHKEKMMDEKNANWIFMVILLSLCISWLYGFSGGLRDRTSSYTPEYPPAAMIKEGMGRAFITSVIFGTCIGYWVLDLSMWVCAFSGFLSYFLVTILFQTIFHLTKFGPLTAYHITEDPKILSSDAYRGIWTFPIIATIILAIIGEWLPHQTIHTYLPIVVTSGVAQCASYAGHASGYIP